MNDHQDVNGDMMDQAFSGDVAMAKALEDINKLKAAAAQLQTLSDGYEQFHTVEHVVNLYRVGLNITSMELSVALMHETHDLSERVDDISTRMHSGRISASDATEEVSMAQQVFALVTASLNAHLQVAQEEMKLLDQQQFLAFLSSRRTHDVACAIEDFLALDTSYTHDLADARARVGGL